MDKPDVVPLAAPKVVAPPSRTELIDLNLIDIPPDTREHDLEEIDKTARNMAEVGQLQAIAVLAKEGGRYDVIFGKGRVLAARKAGRIQIKAEIYQGLSPYQRLDMIDSENERREPTNPIYRAQLLQGMLDTGEAKSQAELAKLKGIPESILSEILSFRGFPKKALEIFVITKITHTALREVKTLPEEGQLDIAHELKSGELKPDGVVQRCKKWAKDHGISKGKHSKGFLSDPTDRYSELWPELRDKLPDCPEKWAVVYSLIGIGKNKDLAWMFGIKDIDNVTPKRLAVWFYQMGKKLGELTGIDPSVPWPTQAEKKQAAQTQAEAEEAQAEKELKAEEELNKQLLKMNREAMVKLEKSREDGQRAAKLWVPRDEQEAQDMKASPVHIRLPQTPAETAEVEALAQKSPGDFFAWLYGADTYWARRSKSFTWGDLGETDPIRGARKIIDDIRKGQEARKTFAESGVVSALKNVLSARHQPTPAGEPAKQSTMTPEEAALVEELSALSEGLL